MRARRRIPGPLLSSPSTLFSTSPRHKCRIPHRTTRRPGTCRRLRLPPPPSRATSRTLCSPLGHRRPRRTRSRCLQRHSIRTSRTCRLRVRTTRHRPARTGTRYMHQGRMGTVHGRDRRAMARRPARRIGTRHRRNSNSSRRRIYR